MLSPMVSSKSTDSAPLADSEAMACSNGAAAGYLPQIAKRSVFRPATCRSLKRSMGCGSAGVGLGASRERQNGRQLLAVVCDVGDDVLHLPLAEQVVDGAGQIQVQCLAAFHREVHLADGQGGGAMGGVQGEVILDSDLLLAEGRRLVIGVENGEVLQRSFAGQLDRAVLRRERLLERGGAQISRCRRPAGESVE